MMRIGIDARRYSLSGRGQERYVRALVRGLPALAWEHELVLLCGPRTAPVDELGPRVRAARADRRLRLQYRRRLAGLRRLLVRDLDLVHFPLADGWYTRVRPNVVTIHDLSALRYPDAYFTDHAHERRAWEHHRAVTEHADAVIAVSRATERDVVDLLDVPPERVGTIPHGVGTRFRPPSDGATLHRFRARYGLPPRYVLFVGGIDFKKNVPRLVEGFAGACAEAGLPHALVMAGALQQPGNAFFDRARSVAIAKGVSDRVVWLGYVPEADLPSLYAGAEALVFPSLVEGFGLPVLEAMACGTPVVASAHSAMSEITGDAAVLVDPQEPSSIAEGILRVLDPDVASRLAATGLRCAAAYSWARTCRRTLEVYERVGRGGTLDAPANARAPAVSDDLPLGDEDLRRVSGGER